MLIRLCDDKFYPDNEARGHYHYDPAVHNYARPEWCKGWRQPSEQERREFLAGPTKSNQENKMLVKHYCEGKSYDVPQAAQHPHMTGLLPCSMGWSKRIIVKGSILHFLSAGKFRRDESTFEAGPQIQAEVNRKLDEYARLTAGLGLTPPLVGERHPTVEERLTAPLNFTVTPAPPTDNYRRITGDPQKPETTAKPQEGSSNPTLTQEEAKRMIFALQDIKTLLVHRSYFNSARKVGYAIDFIGGVQRLLPSEKVDPDARVEVTEVFDKRTGQRVSYAVGGVVKEKKV